MLRPLDPPRRLLMGSGPSNPEPRVLQAMAAPPVALEDPAFGDLVGDCEALLRAVFQAGNASALTVPGASRAGLEAALASLVEPGDRVLVGVYGHFGELLCTLAKLHGAQVERAEAEWGAAVDADALANRIRDNPPKLVAIVHADTSTGIVQPLAPIGAACQETGSLLLVDAVLSIGGCEVDFDAWQLDVAVGGLQKCLGGPPGLALLACSPRVEQALGRRTRASHSVYLDLAHPLDVSTTMVMAAREALRLVLDEGLAARWDRHRKTSQMLRAGIDAMGLRRFGDERQSVPMITLVEVPLGVDDASVREQLLVEHGIEIMAAFGPLRGRVWRIGTMGTNACLPSVLTLLSGLEAVLASRGYQLPRGAAVDAARAVSRRPL
jgi:(S)-ureidoglycine-glyoxylate aminotransferase